MKRRKKIGILIKVIMRVMMRVMMIMIRVMYLVMSKETIIIETLLYEI